MDSKDIKTITLRVNSEDAAKKLEDLNKKLERANAAREESAKLEAQLAQQIEDTKSRQEKLNAQLNQGNLYAHEAKRIKGELKKTEKEISTLERDRAKAQKETIRQIKEATKAQGSIDKTRGQYAALERTMQNLGKATVPELKNAIKILERTMNSGAVERETKEWATFEEQLRECNQELALLERNKLKNDPTADKAASFGTRWVGFTTMVNFAAQAIDRVTGAARELVEEYAQMDEHLADVTKYTGLSKEAVGELNDAFKQMDTRTPREALNDLAADAGRLGIQSKEKVMEFVQAADMINVALGEDLGEDAVKNIGKLTQLFKVDETLGLRDGMLATASVINELAQTSSASEPYILEFTSRLAGVGYQAGIEQPKIMAFASVLDQGMVGVEKGATALQNIITALMRKPAELATIAGLDVREFTQLLKTDANAALIQFIEAVNKAGRLDAIAPMLDDMKLSGSGATQVMATLANNIDLVKNTQAQATLAFKEGKSVVEEFDKANSTPLAELEKAQKKFRDARIELGKAFAPIASGLVSTTSLSVKLATAMIKVLVDYKDVVFSLALTWGIYTAVIFQATIAQKAALVLAKARAAWSKITAALYAIETIAIEGMKLAYFRLTGQTAAATAAQQALNAAMGANPIGALLVLISLAVIAYKTLAGQMSDTEKAQKELDDIKTKATKNLEEERLHIELLRKAAMDETKSLEDRKAAVDKLNAIIPDYNAQIDETTGKYKESKEELDKYLTSLQKKYELEGARETLVKLGQQKAEAELKVRDTYETWKNDRAYAENDDFSNKYVPFVYPYRKGVEIASRIAYGNAIKERDEILAKTKAIMGLYGEDLAAVETKPASVKQGDDSTGNGYTPTSSTTSAQQNETERRRIEQAKADIEKWMEEKKQIETAGYQAGQITLREHREALLAIEREARLKQRDIYEKGSDDWMKANAEIQQLEKEQTKKRNEWSIEQLDIEQKEELRALDERAATTLMKEEDLQEERNRIAIKYLEKRRDLYRDFGQVEDHAKAELALKEEENRQKMDKERKFSEKVKKLREEYAQKSATEVMAIEIDTLSAAREKGLVDEETYQKMLLQIRLKYHGHDGKNGQIGAERKAKRDEAIAMATPKAEEEYTEPARNDFGISALARVTRDLDVAKKTYDNLDALRKKDLISQEAYNDAIEALDKQRFDRFSNAAEAAYATVGAMMQSLSGYQQAASRAEETKITAKYDAEIKAAEGNSEKVKQLEEQKAKEIAAIKSKANKRAMAIEIAQASAAAAMAALNAYKSTIGIPVVGPVMAPIAAAAAAAFGALQIATIVKQHEAQEAGYYEGGFTGGTQYRRRAGVVHEGEFVANHYAVQNPNVLPVLRLLDHAQRNNTIASLTAADVSRAIAPTAQISAVSGATVSPTAPTVQVVPTEAPATIAAIRQLAEILAGGISATVAIDGQNGVAHQLKKYNDLKNRK